MSIVYSNNLLLGSGSGGGSSGTAWGNITGTLSNQTDLNTELTTIKNDVDDLGDQVSEIVAKTFLQQFNTMPTASSSNLNDIVEYRGTTTSTYTNGYIYKCVETSTGVYGWVSIPVSEASVTIDNNTITKNASDQLQTNGILNQRTSTALKVWNGSLNNWTHSGEITNWYNWRGGFPYLNARAVGSLTITSDFVVSGFSTSSSGRYLQIFQNLFDDANTWEIKLKFTTGTDISTNQKLLHACVSHYSNYGLAIYIASNHFGIMGSSNGSSWLFSTAGSYTVLADTTYYLKVTFDGTKYVLSYSLDDETYTDDITYTSSTKLYSTLPHVWLGLYGGYNVYNPFLGSVNLKECYIKVDDSIVWKGVDTLHTTTNVVNEGSGGEVTILPNGLATGFSVSGGGCYLNIPSAFDYSQDFEFVVKIYRNPSTGACIIGNNVDNATGGGIVLRTNGANRLYLWGTTDGSSWTTSQFDTGIDLFSAGGTQYIKLAHANSQYVVSTSTDGITWTTGNALSSAGFTSSMSSLGSTGSAGSYRLQGSMDLKECYIKVGNTVTWQGATINENYVTNATPVVGDSLYSAPNVVANGILANVVGDLTISDDNAVSGFATNAYLTTNSFTLQTGDILTVKVKSPDSLRDSIFWSNGSYYLIWKSGSQVFLYNSSSYVYSSLSIGQSTDFIAKLEIGESTIGFSTSKDGTTWSSVKSLARDDDFSQTNYFGVKSDLSSNYIGTIYMSGCSVTRNGSTIWSGVGALTVSSIASNVISVANGSTYNRNASGDLQTEKTVGEAHSDYLCFVDNKDVRLGTTTIAEIAPTKISDLEDDTTTTPIDKADTLTGLTATVSELNYSDGVTSNIQTQLDAKASASEVVTLTGMQTISGIKVFTDNPILQSVQPTIKLYETDVEKGVTPSQTENSFLGVVYDKNGSSQSNKLAQIFSEYKTDGSLSLNMSCFNPVSGSTASDKIMIAYDSSNQSYTQCPTPTEDTTSSVQIDTVGARNTKLATKQDVRQTIADTTSTTATISNLQAGCDYTFSNALVSLTISAVTSSMYESCVYFTAGTGITVSLPSDIKMLGSTPSYSAGNSYVICFKNGFAVVGVYEA